VHTWNSTASNMTAKAQSTNGGKLDWVCGNNGNWNRWEMYCPNSDNSYSCSGGWETYTSSNGERKCRIEFTQTLVWNTISIGNWATDLDNSGARWWGTCTPSWWVYQLSCPNITQLSCPEWRYNIASKSGKWQCIIEYKSKNIGESQTAKWTNGGEVRWVCGSDGVWKDVVEICP
jgi:hypothetical protein